MEQLYISSFQHTQLLVHLHEVKTRVYCLECGEQICSDLMVNFGLGHTWHGIIASKVKKCIPKS